MRTRPQLVLAAIVALLFAVSCGKKETEKTDKKPSSSTQPDAVPPPSKPGLTIPSPTPMPLPGVVGKKSPTRPGPKKTPTTPPTRSLLLSGGPTSLLPASTYAVLQFRTNERMIALLGLANLRKTLTRQLNQVSQGIQRRLSAPLLNRKLMAAAGVDVKRPFALGVVELRGPIVALVLPLSDPKIFETLQTTLLTAVKRSTVGKVVILTEKRGNRLIVLRDGHAIILTASGTGRTQLVEWGNRIANLTLAGSLAKEPQFLAAMAAMDYGRDVTGYLALNRIPGALFPDVGKRSKPLPPGELVRRALLVSMLGSYRGFSFGGTFGRDLLWVKYFLGLTPGKGVAGIFGNPLPAIGATVVKRRPSFALRSTINIPILLDRLAAFRTSSGSLKQRLDRLQLIPGKNLSELLKLFSGAIELYVHGPAAPQPEPSQIRLHLFLGLTDAKTVRTVLTVLGGLSKGSWKSLTIGTVGAHQLPLGKRRVYLAVVKRTLVLTTDKEVISNLAEGKRDSFLDRIKNTHLRTIFAHTGPLVLHLNWKGMAGLLFPGKRVVGLSGQKPGREETLSWAALQKFGTLSMSLVAAPSAMVGMLLWHPDANGIASFVRYQLRIIGALSDPKVPLDKLVILPRTPTPAPTKLSKTPTTLPTSLPKTKHPRAKDPYKLLEKEFRKPGPNNPLPPRHDPNRPPPNTPPLLKKPGINPPPGPHKRGDNGGGGQK